MRVRFIALSLLEKCDFSNLKIQKNVQNIIYNLKKNVLNNNHYRNYDSFVYFNFDEIQECPEDLNTLISQIQRELIEVYENDFSKHNGRVNSGRIRMVFRSIVSQLAKPNEKFMYGAVREGGRARDFEEAIECSYFLFLTRDFSNT